MGCPGVCPGVCAGVARCESGKGRGAMGCDRGVSGVKRGQ